MATVINYMKDGTICRTREELIAYADTHPFPPDAARLILWFIQDGQKKLEAERRAKLAQGEERAPHDT